MTDLATNPAQANPEAGIQTDEPVTPATTGEEVKAEGGKTPEEPGSKEPEGAPESYDLKVPEKSLLQTADVDRLKTKAKELGLTNTEAQEYLDVQNEAVSSYHDAQMSQVEEARASWLVEAKADKEIGGDGFKENVELAKRVVDRIDSPVFKKLLDDTGFGNHPEVVRAFVRLGKLMANDKLVVPKSTSATSVKTMEEIFYPNT